MSDASDFPPALSLTQHFTPPEGYAGTFGWLCGYSADAAFLDDAVERFTGQMFSGRANAGTIALAVMLDPGNEQIRPVEAPGILHVGLCKKAPFKLLHAKVAVLGFQHRAEPHDWHIRLLVSTGNWTRDSLERSLDLVWRIDLDGADLHAAVSEQRRVDLSAAWQMLNWLRGYFDFRALYGTSSAGKEGQSHLAADRVEAWLRTVTATVRGTTLAPRYFDNRKQGLLAQLPSLVRQQGGAFSRNYLALGSGFYESANDATCIPGVLKKIHAALDEADLLTAKAEIDVFVNPLACQAVHSGMPGLQQAGWSVRAAATPPAFGSAPRELHAKFIFSANHRPSSDVCLRPWLYLGSGNLTGPGIVEKMRAGGGNLEAGVVFAPQHLVWRRARGQQSVQMVSEVLPVQWQEDGIEDATTVAPGGNMPERPVLFLAPPLAYLVWRENEDGGWLVSDGEAAGEFELLDSAAHPCPGDTCGRYIWLSAQPREVMLRWRVADKTQIAAVPVIDEHGRIAGTALLPIELEEAWGLLLRFPLPPDDDDDVPGDKRKRGNKKDGRGSTPSPAARYCIRSMMELIENIAIKQTALREHNWHAWCHRLEQCLMQAAGSDVVLNFTRLAINPLSPLWQVPFRPDFAATSDSPAGQAYEAALARIEEAWGVNELAAIGATA